MSGWAFGNDINGRAISSSFEFLAVQDRSSSKLLIVARVCTYPARNVWALVEMTLESGKTELQVHAETLNLAWIKL